MWQTPSDKFVRLHVKITIKIHMASTSTRGMQHMSGDTFRRSIRWLLCPCIIADKCGFRCCKNDLLIINAGGNRLAMGWGLGFEETSQNQFAACRKKNRCHTPKISILKKVCETKLLFKTVLSFYLIVLYIRMLIFSSVLDWGQQFVQSCFCCYCNQALKAINAQ